MCVSINDDTTHVVFHQDITLEEGLASSKVLTLPKSAVPVNVDWLSACIAGHFAVHLLGFIDKYCVISLKLNFVVLCLVMHSTYIPHLKV